MSKPILRSYRPNRVSLSPRQGQPKQCPLDDPKLGIISMNDHQVGLCICRFCKCGNHLCPAQKIKNNYMSNTYKSKYSYDFKNRTNKIPKKRELSTYFRSPGKMELVTTNMVDFKESPIKLQKRNFSQKKNWLNFSLNARSIYQQQFANWGPNQVVHQKRFYAPLRSTQIPFRSNSSYRDMFKQEKQSVIKTPSFRANLTRVFLGPKEIPTNKSTYLANMQDYSKVVLNSRVKPKAEEYLRSCVSPRHFNTTSSSSFKGLMLDQIDPKKLRISVE